MMFSNLTKQYGLSFYWSALTLVTLGEQVRYFRRTISLMTITKMDNSIVSALARRHISVHL